MSTIRLLKGQEVEVASVLAETASYRGFEIEVHELDLPGPLRFQPVILQDDQVVRRIFVRSKTPYVSMNHFAKRAVDHFLRHGEWPRKQGATVSPQAEG